MSEKGNEARRAYKREWARRNPDKIRAQQRRYRYNCLDWVRDMGLWEETVTPLFQPGGFWG